MKDLIIIIIIVASIICGSYSACHFYQELYEEYSLMLEELVYSINMDFDKEMMISKIEKNWVQKEKILIILQDHASMDRIEENLYECFHFYRIGDLEELILAKNKTLAGMEDLVKREKVLLVDIL